MAWCLHKIDCGYEFIGGYQYLDVCGSILRDSHLQLGYIPSSINADKVIASKNPEGFVVNISNSMFSMMQEEPDDRGEMFLDEFGKWQPLIWSRISPISCEKCKLVLEFILPVDSEEEVFRKLRQIDVPLFIALSNSLGIPELMQNLTFMFKSGSTTVECTFMGSGFSTPFASRNSINFFATDRQRKLENMRFCRKNKAAGNEYSWAVDMKITVTEDSPEYPEKQNDWGMKRFKRLVDLAWEVREKTGKIVRL